MREWNPNLYGSKDQGIDRSKRQELSPVLLEAHSKAEKLLNDHAIRLSSFSDLYGSDVIARDVAAVTSLQKEFAKDVDPVSAATGRIFEAVVFDEAERSNWLGQDAETIKSSDFDDYKNGVDMVVEFDADKHSPKHLALAVDVTFGTSALKKKFDRIRAEIDADELGHMKYFLSQRSNIRGELSQLPRAVVGVEHSTVIQLAGLWTKGHAPQLAQHEVQRIITEEIHQQMRTFLSYARKKGSPKAIAAYGRAVQVSGRILDEKRSVRFNELDKVFQGIRSELLSF